MKTNSIIPVTIAIIFTLNLSSCRITGDLSESKTIDIPELFRTDFQADSNFVPPFQSIYQDSILHWLIQEGISHNAEMNKLRAELLIKFWETSYRRSLFLPQTQINSEVSSEKVGRYTSQGANDANTDIKPGLATPEFLGNKEINFTSAWEIDIWQKLHNQRKAALFKYASFDSEVQFFHTILISEIAKEYYHLLSLDNKEQLINRFVVIQQKALEAVEQQKQATRVTELAVKRFEAQLYYTKSLLSAIHQEQLETENTLSQLIGCPPKKIPRNPVNFTEVTIPIPCLINPKALVSSRPDLKSALLEINAEAAEVNAAKAEFYPAFEVSGHLGSASYELKSLLQFPMSAAMGLGAGLHLPIFNRIAIRARYNQSQARLKMAAKSFDQKLLSALNEIDTQLNAIKNSSEQVELIKQQVIALDSSVDISNLLFNAARADYVEVLLTQREALEATLSLIEHKEVQLIATVNLYKALGGGSPVSRPFEP